MLSLSEKVMVLDLIRDENKKGYTEGVKIYSKNESSTVKL